LRESECVYDYESEAAGDYLAMVVCSALQAINEYEYADFISQCKHQVLGTNFDEDNGYYMSFQWMMYASPSVYGRMRTEERKDFRKAILDLGLSLLDPVLDIKIEIEHIQVKDWKAHAQAAAAQSRARESSSKHKTISPETIADFRNASSDYLTLRLIDDVFAVGKIDKGEWEGYDSSQRRTRFMDYITAVDESKPGEAEKLSKSLLYMLGVLREKGTPEEKIGQLRLRLEEDGFISSVPITKAISEKTPTSTDLVDSIIDTLRGVPRALREMEQENRYNNRDYNLIRIADEYDLQDFVRAFLKLRFPRAKVENAVGQTAGVGGRVDFSLGNEKIFIELKVIRRQVDWKAMLADITSKFERYSADADCDDIVVFIYDPNTCLREAAAIEADLTQPRSKGSKKYNTYVVVRPQK